MGAELVFIFGRAMPEWTWKQAVADQVLELVHQKLSPQFSLDEVYTRLQFFEQLFPGNRHIREKIRQQLQVLRDDGLLIFHGSGEYALNLQFSELTAEPPTPLPSGSVTPPERQVLRTVRLRDTLLAIEIKRRYAFICQVCRQPVVLSAMMRYAEGHHLQPLGHPHLGPDVPGNIVVLCPNHHVMFDRGALTVVPDTMAVRHVVDGILDSELRLYVEEWHPIDPTFLRYHHERIFRAA
jgi:hypothetical protein